jgi:hypothetical protein
MKVSDIVSFGFGWQRLATSVRKLRSHSAHLASLEDSRVHRTRQHNLLTIITMAHCAVICGADTWVDVEKFGKTKAAWLGRFLALPNGIPSHDIFGRVFAAILPEKFQMCFHSWMCVASERMGLK